MVRMAMGGVVLGGILLVACAPLFAPTAGQALFSDYCAVCHGPDGRGRLANGPDVPDLTGLSARNGGVFPLVAVMSKIDGYTRASQTGVEMPEFGALLNSPDVLIDTGDGILTPTPKHLVDLAAYLDFIQQ
jgi:mono/diheme cytochrome c family protein